MAVELYGMPVMGQETWFRTPWSELLARFQQTENIHKAWALAILLHVMLAFLLPGIPEFKVPDFSRAAALNVFLQREEEPQKFEQVLDQSLPTLNANQELQEAQVEASSIDPQKDETISDEAPELENTNGESFEKDPAGIASQANSRPSILVSRSFIRRFTDLEAATFAEQNPDDLSRFSRSFASFRSLQRRNETASHQNRFGDVYVRNSASSGDVCFVQQQDRLANEATTRTVYFYRCDSKPKSFELAPKG